MLDTMLAITPRAATCARHSSVRRWWLPPMSIRRLREAQQRRMAMEKHTRSPSYWRSLDTAQTRTDVQDLENRR